MIYIRICWAAIQRYRLESPVRIMWADFTEGSKRRHKKLKMPFPSIVAVLVEKGLIDRDDQGALVKEYNRLSNLLHGQPGA